LCNTSFVTRSVQIIFSILLQHDTSNLTYFGSIFRIVKVSVPYKAVIQIWSAVLSKCHINKSK
jgi:hypothetical protein